MSGSMITGLPGAPEVYASAQRTACFPTAQLISLADAEDDGGRGLPRFRGAHVWSTMVLTTKGSGKTHVVYASVAFAVAFMGPKRWWPPVFYFSSMMAADAEALSTDSSLSMHPTYVSACMARPPAWESRPQKRETRSQTRVARYEAMAWMAATTPVRRLGRQLAPSGEGREVDQRAA